jgi:cell division protein FtsL
MILKFISLSGLLTISFFSCYFLIWQTYEYKVAFSHADQLKIENGELSSQSNILIEDVEYFRNQLTLREVSQNNLGMRAPSKKEKILISRNEI